jgi:hypothetical protein
VIPASTLPPQSPGAAPGSDGSRRPERSHHITRMDWNSSGWLLALTWEWSPTSRTSTGLPRRLRRVSSRASSNRPRRDSAKDRGTIVAVLNRDDSSYEYLTGSEAVRRISGGELRPTSGAGAREDVDNSLTVCIWILGPAWVPKRPAC